MKKINNILYFRELPNPIIRSWVIGVVACTIFVSIINAQWLECPEEERRILIGCLKSVMVTDENGGAIVVGEALSTTPYLSAQKVDQNGYSVWDPDNYGLFVSPIGDDQTDARIVSDGEGGVFIGFNSYTLLGSVEDDFGHIHELNNREVIIQHIGSDGEILWNNGISLAEADTNKQRFQGIVSDGEDGVLIVYSNNNEINFDSTDYDNYTQPGIFMQRLDEDGNKMFEDLGIRIIEDWNSVGYFNSSADGNSSVIDAGGNNIYIVDTDSIYNYNNMGYWLWTIPNNFGFEVDIGFNSEDNGIILTGDYWYGYGVDRRYVLKSQKIVNNGNLIWGEGGIVLDTMYVKWAHNAVTNGNSGAIYTFTNIDSVDKLININEFGNVIWNNEVLVNGSSTLTSDFNDGVVFYSPSPLTPELDFNVWRTTGGDQHLWGEKGITMSINSYGSPVIIANPNGGLIISREQASTAGFGRGIYLKKVDQWGILGGDDNYDCGDADLNLDNEIDVLDIVRLVNYILEIDILTFCGWEICAADANVDHSIDVLDIVIIVNIILNY